MTTVELTTLTPTRLGGVISWWDPLGECAMTIADPHTAPELFAEYHTGAVKSYARFGVGDALDADVARCADDTTLFWALTDVDGRVIGGVRAKGPLRSPEESHAVVEWHGRPGEDAVHAMISERIPFGILEMKAAWLSSRGSRNENRAKMIARSGFHAMELLGIEFCMATSAAHILEQWRSSGGVVAPIPATPYPDERYQTKMMWWDRHTFTDHGEPAQIEAIETEMARAARTLASFGLDDDEDRDATAA
ncbi:hypothetical protein MMAD_27630 [Mycolicibacterium madagascariense]|uniref:N-acetyltransferase n=1 Tax=Mycolicibacterium madagascariense TaxID=212765 RepID=A0A7I7XGY4_9MYCO|nr:hypothetical protein [Mycolicibacterium madagascariense]MCV7011148.1 hypothetical protein [Mycolicibacterium madagascariense]BBZ28468.1 hypothetical protein MMAD_27630 [Mycolicibacterium madagascariense]